MSQTQSETLDDVAAAIEASIREGTHLSADVVRQVAESRKLPEHEVRTVLDELMSRGRVVVTSAWKLRTST